MAPPDFYNNFGNILLIKKVLMYFFLLTVLKNFHVGCLINRTYLSK